MLGVLAKLAALLLAVEEGVGDRAEGRAGCDRRVGGALGGALLGERVALVDDDALPQFEVAGAGLGVIELVRRAERRFALLAAVSISAEI